MSFTKRLARIIFIFLLTIVFAFAAYYLFQRQNEKYTFLSFRIENEKAAVMIPNIDRLFNKIRSVDELELNNLPADLISGIQFLIEKKNFLFSDEVSRDCFFSFNETDFSIAFNTAESDAYSIADLITAKFEVSSIAGENSIEINGKSYHAKNYNQFLVISTLPVIANKNVNEKQFGNADFIIYNPEYPQGTHHIISDEFHHQVWEDSLAGPVGQPIQHASYLQFVPAGFDEIYFYGSSRMETDHSIFFNQPGEGSFKWVDDGLIILKKDSFCLMIAPQNLEQDLKLILEEQTLTNQHDSIQIPYFNIGPFEIMPFSGSFNWAESIPEITDPFKFYTSVDNFNIVANSIPAMRWYLGELQLGNSFFKNSQTRSLYQKAIPQRSHCMAIRVDENGEFALSSTLWRSTNICVNTSTHISTNAGQSESVQLIADFEVEIIPSQIQSIRKSDSAFILLSNQNQIVLYDTLGNKKWALNLSTSLTGKPQIIDLEGDGQNEIVLFQSNQLDVVNDNGKSVPNFPKKFDGVSKGGLAIDYENLNNYRFVVSIGNQVRSFDENAAPVQGWLFPGMSAELNGTISYFATDGKDLIVFKDMNNKVYILNRRGESRLNKESVVRLPNESSFAVGNYEASSLRKMGYKNNFIYNHYLVDGQKDSLKLDKEVMATNVIWMFNNNHPLLVIEETGRVIVFDEFGYEKNSVLKPDQTTSFIEAIVKQDFTYVFVDNSQNNLYLLNGYGKMIFPLPIKGTSVYLLNEELLYTFVGTKIKIYKTE